MANDYGLDRSGNVVIQQAAASGQGPVTRLEGGGGGGFTAFAQGSQGGGGDFSKIGEDTAKTLDAINALADKKLTPLVQAELQRQYYHGMSQVAQGKTLQEIQKERPWYTEIFGPSATVRGAQAMTLTNALNTAQADFLERMPQLREQPPDAVSRYLADQALRIGSTGDASMDAMVQAKLAEQWGPMLGLHMKQHVAYVQEQNVTAFGNATVTAGDVLQQTVTQGSGFYSIAQMQAEQARAVSAFAPIPGMTDQAWASTTAQGLKANMLRGNFAIYDAFKTSPLWEKLPLTARMDLEHTLPLATQHTRATSSAWRDDVSNVTALQIALAQGTGPQSITALQAYVQQENDQFMRATGGSAPKFDNNDMARLEKLWYQGEEFKKHQVLAAREAAAGAGQNAAVAAVQQEAILRAVNEGAAPPELLTKLPTELVQHTLADKRTQLEQAGDAAGLQVWLSKLPLAAQNAKMVDTALAHDMTADMNNLFVQGAPITPRMRQTLDRLQTMTAASNGMAGTAQYIGNENVRKLMMFLRQAPNLSDDSSVDAARGIVQRGWDAHPTAADEKAVADYLQHEDPGFIRRHLPLFGPGALSGYDLNEASKQHMAQDMAPDMARMMRGMNLTREQALPLAFDQRYGPSSGTDFIGGTYVPGTPVSQGESLYAHTLALTGGALSQLSPVYQEALNRVIVAGMAEKIGKPPVTDTTRRDAAPGGLPTAAITTERFNPDDYIAAGGTAIGGGVITLSMLPKSAAHGAKPTTLYITPERVAAALQALQDEDAKRFVIRGPAGTRTRDAYSFH